MTFRFFMDTIDTRYLLRGEMLGRYDQKVGSHENQLRHGLPAAKIRFAAHVSY